MAAPTSTVSPKASAGLVPRSRRATAIFAVVGLAVVLLVLRYSTYPYIDHDAAEGLMVSQQIGERFCYCFMYEPMFVFPPGESVNGIPQYVAGLFFAISHNPDIASVGTATAGMALLVLALLIFEPWLAIATGVLLLIWPRFFLVAIVFSGEVWALAFILLGVAALRRTLRCVDLSAKFSPSYIWPLLCFGFAIEAKLLASITLFPLIFAIAYQELRKKSQPAAGILRPLLRAILVTGGSVIGAFAVLALFIAFSVGHSIGHWHDFALMGSRFLQFISAMISMGKGQATQAFTIWQQSGRFDSPTVIVLLLLASIVLIVSNWTYAVLVVSTLAFWLHFGGTVERHFLIAIYVVIVVGAATFGEMIRDFSLRRGWNPLWPQAAAGCLGLIGVALLTMLFGTTFAGPEAARPAAGGADRAHVVLTSQGPFIYDIKFIEAIRKNQFVVTSGFWNYPEMALREHLHLYDRNATENKWLPVAKTALLFDVGNHTPPATSIRGNCGAILARDGPLVLCRIRRDAPINYLAPAEYSSSS